MASVRLPVMEPLAAEPEEVSQTPASSSLGNRRPRMAHRGSSAISIDYFDPTGVGNLRRTFSRMSSQRFIPAKQDSAILPEADSRQEEVPSLRVVSTRDAPGGTREEPSSSIDSEATFVPGQIPFDFEHSLRDYIHRRDLAGVEPRELGVLFDKLTVVGLGASARFQPTIGSLFNPINLLRAVQSLRHPPLRDIITGFEGVVRPGEMLLVLGRPGSGCTTLLKTLTNQTSSFQSISGHVSFISSSPQTFLSPPLLESQFRGDVQYTPEDDLHFASLKVEDTIQFAAKCRAPAGSTRIGFKSTQTNAGTSAGDVESQTQTREQYEKMLTDVYLTIFGLRAVRQSVIGDEKLRGVSGGEKKRVSIAESLAARALIAAWDNSTRGLDSSTALSFLYALRLATTHLRTTTLVSLYQASDAMYELFDKVCILYEGRMVFVGQADEAKGYFERMGWRARNRQSVPDFLVAVTDDSARVWASEEKENELDSASDVPSGSDLTKHKGSAPPSLPPPRTAEEFATYYMRSDERRRNRKDMDAYRKECLHPTRTTTDSIGASYSGLPPSYDGKSSGHQHLSEAYKRGTDAEHARHTRKGSPYVISLPMQLRAVMVRRMRIVKGNLTPQVLTSAVFILQSVIISTTFVKIQDATSAYFSRGGVLFFALFLPALFTMSEIPALFSQRPIIQRHHRAGMYHPMVEALALTLVDIPLTLATMAVYSIILYFVVGLQRSAGQFFIFFLFIVATALSMKSFFRALAAAFSQEAPAQAVAGIMLLALSLYTGYQIPLPSMIGALKWISYINPVRYSFEALMVNEFHTLNGRCSTLVPSGSGYEGVALENQVCTTVGSVPGQLTVDGNRFVDVSFGYSYSHLWRNFGILVAFGIFFTLCLLLFTEIQTTTGHSFDDIVLFKRGSKAGVVQEATATVRDNEKERIAADPTTVEKERAKEKEAIAGQPKMADVFSWSNLTYKVPMRGGEQQVLLDDVSGYVAPGKLTALMGASGAGKTTLLNVLAGRVSIGVVSGERMVNGQPPPNDFQAQTGYCQQVDTHVPTTTVREALRFSARLRQPQSIPLQEKDAYAEKCLRMCGLEAFGDAMIGSLGVEHRKRTTIGVELAAKPQLLLFLDEPTSGLDSQSAWAIVSFLRDLADNGQAILCTIHQPSAELFQVFDRLLLLCKGGRTVYFGDLGHQSVTLINYFEGNGARRCKDNENPAEYMLEVIGAGATAITDRDWHDVWVKSGGASKLAADITQIHAQGRPHPPVREAIPSTFTTSWPFQLKELTIRQFRSYWRNPTYIMAKLTLNVIGGLFIGFTFFKAKDTLQDTQNKLFAIFMGTILSSPLAGQMQVPFIKMRDIYEVRERSSRTYSWTALITSQMLVELPWNMFGSTLLFFCWYWTVGFVSSRAAYTYLFFGFLFPAYYTTISLAVASMAPTAEIAGLLFSFLFAFVFTFNGVLQPFSELGWWRWMYRLSPYTYLIEGLLGQVIGGQEVNCAEKEYVTVNPPSGRSCGDYLATYISNKGGYVTNPDATSSCQFCSSRSADQYLGQSFNIYYSHRWRDVGIFSAYLVFNLVAIYVFTHIFRIRSGNIKASLNSWFKSRA